MEQNRDRGGLTVEHDWEGDAPLYVTVASVVAEARGCDPASLPPIANALDPDAFEELVASGRRSGIRVQFRYQRCLVVVDADGTVSVTPEPTAAD